MPSSTTPALEMPLGAELKTAGADISNEEARAIAQDLYGLSCQAEWLWGEKDANFRLMLDDGREYLLKVLNPAEDTLVTNMHTEALLHVEATDPGIPVQRVVRTFKGQPDIRITCEDRRERTVRLVSFVPGLAQKDAPVSSLQRRNVGAMLARLQNALRDFTHPAMNHRITWDIKHALSLRGTAERLADPARGTLLAGIFDAFERDVLPIMAELPSQVIHNDFNRANILVDPASPDDLSGIIDFGDMVHAPVLFDLAVAASYQAGEDGDPIAGMIDFLAGYASVRRPAAREIEHLHVTVLTRLAMRIAIQEQRSALFPEQREIFTRNAPAIWHLIDRLQAIDQAYATSRYAAAVA